MATANTQDPNAPQPALLSDRVNDIMKTDNPLIQGARTAANADANSRGLLNSSIATQAGDTAALGAATTLAQGDVTPQNQFGLQTMQGTQAQGLADTEANYKTLLQSSASASQLFSQTSKNINDIMNDKTTSADFKNTAVGKQNQLLQSSLNVIGGIGNLDLSGLLDFS